MCQWEERLCPHRPGLGSRRQVQPVTCTATLMHVRHRTSPAFPHSLSVRGRRFNCAEVVPDRSEPIGQGIISLRALS